MQQLIMDRTVHKIALLLMVILLLQPMGLFAQIINFENDPNLAEAMKYDSEMNDGTRLDNGQKLAEKHYLKYLETATDSAQRARVYTQLGVLYSTNYHPEKGEKPDIEKSLMYMNKALEEEPERISRATIRARLFMATPDMTPEERLKIRMEVYDWLSSIDDKALTEKWMPQGARAVPNKNELAMLKNLVGAVYRAEGTNLPWEASMTQNPPLHLNKIMTQFPGTLAASNAEKTLAKWERSQIERALNTDKVFDRMAHDLDPDILEKTSIKESGPFRNSEQSKANSIVDVSSERSMIPLVVSVLCVVLFSVGAIAVHRHRFSKRIEGL